MIRALILAIVALSVGIAGGALAVRGRLVAAFQERDRLIIELDKQEKAYSQLQADAAVTAEQLTRLGSEQEFLGELVGELQAAAAAVPEPLPAEIAVALPENASNTMEEPEERRPRRRRDRAMAGNEDEEDRVDWGSRRQEYVTAMRERFRETMDAEIQEAADPVAQERLGMISIYAEDVMDLRGQLRAAETDEEREDLRIALEETATALRGLVQEHQDYKLRQFAAEYGITGAEKQDAFLNSLRETLESPLPGRGFSWGRGGPGFGSRRSSSP